MMKIWSKWRGFVAVPLMALVIAFGNADAQAETSVSQVEANRKLVLDFWRVVIEGNDLDAATQYCAEDLIQHNPLMANGIASMVARFKVLSNNAAKRPLAPALRNPPAIVMAEDDLVLLMWQRPTPEPADPTKTYDRFSFDLYRVKDGKIVEHWDAVAKPVP